MMASLIHVFVVSFMTAKLTSHWVSVLWIQCLIYLIKQVKRGRITFLNGKDEGQSHEGLLASGQLLHLLGFWSHTGEGNLQCNRQWGRHLQANSTYSPQSNRDHILFSPLGEWIDWAVMGIQVYAILQGIHSAANALSSAACTLHQQAVVKSALPPERL